MKNLLIILLVAAFGCTADAQDISQKEVPTVVLNSFQQQFPQADKLEWAKDNEFFMVEYKLDKKEYSAWIDASGNLLRTGYEVNNDELPAAVKTTIEQQYNGYDVDDVLKMEKPDATGYIVELEKGDEEVFVVFGNDGTVKQ